MAKREHIPARLRHEVFKRDNYRCRECGATNKETTLEIDHIVPVAKGGSNNLSNLQTLCKTCNRAKHTRTWVGGSSKSYESPIKKSKSTPAKEIHIPIKETIVYKTPKVDDLYDSKEFISVLTTYGVRLNCLIPYYGHESNANMGIIHPNPIERFKNVILFYDGIYIDDIFRGKSIKIHWMQIKSVKTYENTIDIMLDDDSQILIYLPDDFDVTDCIHKIILDKIDIANKHKNKCPNCNSTISSYNEKTCDNCGFNFERIDYNIAIDNYILNYDDSSIYDYYFSSKEFISNLKERGVFLSCFIPNYVLDENDYIKIKDDTIVKVFKRVKVLANGIYVEDIFRNNTLRILWHDILNINRINNRLKIMVRRKKTIFINLPMHVIEDFICLIPDKINIEDVEWEMINNKNNNDNLDLDIPVVDDVSEDVLVSKIKKFFRG